VYILGKAEIIGRRRREFKVLMYALRRVARGGENARI
jgi:hypothetical protein